MEQTLPSAEEVENLDLISEDLKNYEPSLAEEFITLDDGRY
jgi:hypothetical protein